MKYTGLQKLADDGCEALVEVKSLQLADIFVAVDHLQLDLLHPLPITQLAPVWNIKVLKESGGSVEALEILIGVDGDGVAVRGVELTRENLQIIVHALEVTQQPILQDAI
ncbi:hypothetical protein MAR_010440 [Mya arenaria]|uniref:Uncharacterized protein n=1 Tax=Mya arenaria TaxID=6604 RepID=A0ABY7E508_MYAAR|nr:hypothetical protein MAR_010440 [Mya arenaria]